MMPLLKLQTSGKGLSFASPQNKKNPDRSEFVQTYFSYHCLSPPVRKTNAYPRENSFFWVAGPQFPWICNEIKTGKPPK